MYFRDAHLIVSPTDLANFLACRHKTALDLLAAKGELTKPTWKDPLADVLRQRGMEHEARYVERLSGQGLKVIDLGSVDRAERAAATLAAMRGGADVIVQAALEDGGWAGFADVLRRVEVPSALGPWSYEAHDTKLSRETKGGTILQLCAYTDLLAALQQRPPEHFEVVTPVAATRYRADDFAAFYRQVKTRFLGFVGAPVRVPTYPDPVDHCRVCQWSGRCSSQRRGDDHLSFVANLGRQHRAELASHDITTLKTFAQTATPLPFKPRRGAVGTYERLREQARLQLEQRESGRPTYECLAVEKGFGLAQLPEPRTGDLFLDLEGDPFGRVTTGAESGEGSREYLFGLGKVVRGAFEYNARWAYSDAEEREAFEATMADIMVALDADPAIHVFHYAPYEPSAFKRLMGRYAAREADVDRLLRGRRFVDLYASVRHALRAGVETYSIKSMEPFYGFVREVELDEAGDERRVVELALETGDFAAITAGVRATVEGYNKDDCRSLVGLRSWLEDLRAKQRAGGIDVPRPPLEPDEPSKKVSERQGRLNDLRERLLPHGDVAAGLQSGGSPNPHYLLAYLLDWHTREDKATWWEYFRLLELPEVELIDEPAAVAGLTFLAELGMEKKSAICRYTYPPQEIEIRPGDALKLQSKDTWGKVREHDRAARTLDVVVGTSRRALRPTSAFVHSYVNPGAVQDSIERIANEALVHLDDEAAGGAARRPSVAWNLLSRTPPLALSTPRLVYESTTDFAERIVHELDGDVLAIQGPPGTGKTYTGARMICALLAAGKRVGVTATSHKVIRNLLDAVRAQSTDAAIGQRVSEADAADASAIARIADNDAADAWLAEQGGRVLGGTAWLWSREESAAAVDVLFIDEAGQMSLANALAVSPAARSLVLLGDPQQLEQPQKGSHPDGIGVSALDHILAGHRTMPARQGLFLPITWRLAPAISRYTSEMFYEGKLESKPGLERQRLMDRRSRGTSVPRFSFDGAGLFYVPADHDGCRSSSDEEVVVVADIVAELLAPGSMWVDEHGVERQLMPADLRIVAPYNAQVSRLQEYLGGSLPIGTVDKFQGQEAPVVVYSMTTSRPEDAPRGLEFLYSPNRLNVATSRAKCAAILVASPRLFEPDCRTPRQMQLANALCRFAEMAGAVFDGT